MDRGNPQRELVLALLSASMRIERALDRALSSIKGISFSEFQLLSALQNEHTQRATRVALASTVGLTPSGVTRALRPLEKLGFVVTERDLRDARRSLAALTPQGVELVEHACKVVDDTLKDLHAVTTLSAADRKRTLAFLREVTPA